MIATTELSEPVYRELLAKSLPRPIRTGPEHDRLTALLLDLDEREEDALAEVLTRLIEDYEESRYPFAQE